jgi:hypothetical protein
MRIPLFRSLAYNYFMTLLGNLIWTTGQGKQKRVESREKSRKKLYMKT